jgi:nitrite reductase (cytochrome c-552)
MSSQDHKSHRGRSPLALGLVAVGAFVVAFGLLALLMSIRSHKEEAANPFFRVVALTDSTEAPEIWGQNFPLQYDAYKKTVDMERTRYGGSEAIPRVPDAKDPRAVVTQSKIELDPRLKRMWAGYSFALDFREERGHAYMLQDQMFTGRQAVPQPGTCLHCHASVYVPYRKAGNGDLFAGFEKLNHMPYAEAAKLVTHPVACIDCHDSQTMQLRITRPAFMEGMRAYKASLGIKDYDVNTMATRQEMRSYVCGQCHVEYSFQGVDKRLVYPWVRGLTVDAALAFYDSIGFKDWTHAETGAPTLKAQHPEFEMWNQGTHAAAGVACADCHMPYVRVGAQKISDHHVRSPLLNINNACQTCHHVSEDELRRRAERIQDRTHHMSDLALGALVQLIDDIVAARKAGATDQQLAMALDYQRKAGFYVDYVEAENSMGFHADQESTRILGESINFSRLGTRSLRDVKR